MTYGLRSFGHALGERVALADVVDEYTDDIERVLGYGYEFLHRAPPEVGLTDLAVAAGERALADGGVEPADVDLVVLAITDLAEYLYWDAAATVHHRLGLGAAEAVLVDQGCASGVTAFDTLAGRFATHPEIETALVIGANRTADAYWNRLATHSLLFSDGAAAAVATRDATSWRWLASHAETDGRYADLFRMDVGGAARPFSPQSPPPAVRDAWDLMEHFGYDADRVADFAEEVSVRTARAVHRACRRAGATEEELGWLLLPHDNAQVLADQIDLVGVPASRTNRALAAAHAHLGAADQLFALSSLHAGGAVAAGDLVALATNGRGMHWAGTILRR